MIHERSNSVLTDSEVRELEAKEPAQIELIKRSMYVLKKASYFEVSCRDRDWETYRYHLIID